MKQLRIPLSRSSGMALLIASCVLAAAPLRAEDPVLIDIRAEIGGDALPTDANEEDGEDAIRRFLRARIEQSGVGNVAGVVQSGSHNEASIVQGGGGSATIIQSGSGNQALIVQR